MKTKETDPGLENPLEREIEKDLLEMCRRLVRLHESRIRIHDPDASFRLDIYLRDGLWRAKVRRTDNVRSSLDMYVYDRDRKMLFGKIIFSYSYRMGLLGSSAPEYCGFHVVFRSGTYEELDLLLSSCGF